MPGGMVSTVKHTDTTMYFNISTSSLEELTVELVSGRLWTLNPQMSFSKQQSIKVIADQLVGRGLGC